VANPPPMTLSHSETSQFRLVVSFSLAQGKLRILVGKVIVADLANPSEVDIFVEVTNVGPTNEEDELD